MTTDEQRELALEKMAKLMLAYNRFKEKMAVIKAKQNQIMINALNQTTAVKISHVLGNIQSITK